MAANGVPGEEINLLLAQSRVGLCLSEAEGAMLASIEYLFAGLSVVSTPSLGGRDYFFDDEFCIICEPDPRSVREAVEALLARNVPRDYVRAKTLARVDLQRRHYIDLVQEIIDRAGGNMRFEDRFWQLTRGRTIVHFRSMKEFSETVSQLVVEKHATGQLFGNDARKPAAGKYAIGQNLKTVAKEMLARPEAARPGTVQKLPLLSFVVINYNYGRFLRACVESIFNQDYPNVECIIVDNASSDNSNDVIDGLVQEYESLKVLRNDKNLGQCAACREGFALTSGAYIAFVDADDYLLPAFAATHIRVHLTMPFAAGFTSADMAQEVDDKIVLGSYFETFGSSPKAKKRSANLDFLHDICDASAVLGTRVLEAPTYSAKIQIVANANIDWVWSPTSGTVYRRDAVSLFADNPRLEQLRFAADAYFNYGINALTGSVLIEKPLAVYRIHSRNNFTNRAALNATVAYTKGKDEGAPAAFFALEHMVLNFEHFCARAYSVRHLWLAMQILRKKSGSKKWTRLEKILAFFVRRYYLYGVRRARAWQGEPDLTPFLNALRTSARRS